MRVFPPRSKSLATLVDWDFQMGLKSITFLIAIFIANTFAIKPFQTM